MRYTLSKPERLTGKKTLSELHQSGEVLKEYPFVLIIKPFDFENNVPARLAVSVPKRKVKLAVKRNLMKRLAREVYRKQKNDLFAALTQNKTQLALLLIYTGDAKFTNDIAEIKITKLLSRLIRKLTPQHPII